MVDLRFDLGKVSLNVSVAFSELLFGVFSDFSSFETLPVLEQTLRPSKEAVERDHFLKES